MLDKFNRPDWDSWFMAKCFMLATKSIDPSTKQGAIIANEDHEILSQGYNGPMAGLDDDDVPLTRPAKYYHLQHAEEAAFNVLTAPRSALLKATIYVTGIPCHKCMRMILNRKIRRIIYGPVNSIMLDTNKEEVIETDRMLANMRKKEPVICEPYLATHSMDELYAVVNLTTDLIKKYEPKA